MEKKWLSSWALKPVENCKGWDHKIEIRYWKACHIQLDGQPVRACIPERRAVEFKVRRLPKPSLRRWPCCPSCPKASLQPHCSDGHYQWQKCESNEREQGSVLPWRKALFGAIVPDTCVNATVEYICLTILPPTKFWSWFTINHSKKGVIVQQCVAWNKFLSACFMFEWMRGYYRLSRL